MWGYTKVAAEVKSSGLSCLRCLRLSRFYNNVEPYGQASKAASKDRMLRDGTDPRQRRINGLRPAPNIPPSCATEGIAVVCLPNPGLRSDMVCALNLAIQTKLYKQSCTECIDERPTCIPPYRLSDID